MASIYNDLFLRDNLADTGHFPAHGNKAASPDIIPFGRDQINDPQAFFSGNFGSDAGKEVVVNENNYIYLRCMNLAAGTEQGMLHLYHCKPALISWPCLWQNQPLQTIEAATSLPVNASGEGDIAVGVKPFVMPSALAENGSYSFVGRIVTLANPNPIPELNNIPDFAAYVSNNKGMGWRNISYADHHCPYFIKSVNYDQGNYGGLMTFLITCVNIPLGAMVALSCSTPGTAPILDLSRTVVQNSERFVIGITTEIPANWSSRISYSYWAGDQPLPTDFSITLSTVYFVQPVHALYKNGQEKHELGLGYENHLHDHLYTATVKGITIGSHTTIGK